MKDFLKKLIEKRNGRIDEIRSAIEASTDVNEVRSLTKEAAQLQEEVRDAETKLQEIEAEEARSAAAQENPTSTGS
jgi:predicted  nucleic acid-binding Zn-ribbon protein